MRIAVLCNDRLGFPAIHQLLPHKLIVAAGTTDRIPETKLIFSQLCAMGNIPLQVFSKKNLQAELMLWLEQHKPDIVLVKTFPYKIPAVVLQIPKFGFVNFHYAPLPEYRGSNPLFWMLRNGIQEGGVTIHQMDEAFDTGTILLQRAVQFAPDNSYGMAVSQLAYTGAVMTGELLHGIMNNSLKPEMQDNSKAKWYGRPKPADLTINWHRMNASEVCALANACNPWNKGAIARYKGWTFAIVSASVSDFKVPADTFPGTILNLDDKNGLIISCSEDQAVRIEVIYAEEGFFAGWSIRKFGLEKGHILDS